MRVRYLKLLEYVPNFPYDFTVIDNPPPDVKKFLDAIDKDKVMQAVRGEAPEVRDAVLALVDALLHRRNVLPLLYNLAQHVPIVIDDYVVYKPTPDEIRDLNEFDLKYLKRLAPIQFDYEKGVVRVYDVERRASPLMMHEFAAMIDDINNMIPPLLRHVAGAVTGILQREAERLGYILDHADIDEENNVITMRKGDTVANIEVAPLNYSTVGFYYEVTRNTKDFKFRASNYDASRPVPSYEIHKPIGELVNALYRVIDGVKWGDQLAEKTYKLHTEKLGDRRVEYDVHEYVARAYTRLSINAPRPRLVDLDGYSDYVSRVIKRHLESRLRGAIGARLDSVHVHHSRDNLHILIATRVYSPEGVTEEDVERLIEATARAINIAEKEAAKLYREVAARVEAAAAYIAARYGKEIGIHERVKAPRARISRKGGDVAINGIPLATLCYVMGCEDKYEKIKQRMMRNRRSESLTA